MPLLRAALFLRSRSDPRGLPTLNLRHTQAHTHIYTLLRLKIKTETEFRQIIPSGVSKDHAPQKQQHCDHTENKKKKHCIPCIADGGHKVHSLQWRWSDLIGMRWHIK